MSKNLATLIGLSAILMWASMVGFVKHITTAIGPDVGITLIYSLSALLLLIIFRVPNFKLISALLHKDLKCKAPLIEPNL
ncbi:hypothetical protein, partial [Acinetobacter baumannii]